MVILIKLYFVFVLDDVRIYLLLVMGWKDCIFLLSEIICKVFLKYGNIF